MGRGSTRNGGPVLHSMMAVCKRGPVGWCFDREGGRRSEREEEKEVYVHTKGESDRDEERERERKGGVRRDNVSGREELYTSH